MTVVKRVLHAATKSLAMAALVFLFGCSESPRDFPAPDESWSIDTAAVLFTGRRGGMTDLYVHDFRTGETQRLTNLGTSQGGANAGRVSPDGQRLAFQVRRDNDYEIHIMNLSSGESRNLTQHADYDVSAAWSPDSRQLAFMSTRGFSLGSIGPFPGHIYVAELDSGAVRQVTNEPLKSALGPSDWSADGKTLLLARTAANGPDVFKLELQTGKETEIAGGPEGEYSARFSHSGDRIAFHAETDAASQIVILDLATGKREYLTSGSGYRYYPKWSPDDKWLLFTASDEGKQFDIKAIRISDRTVRDLIASDDDEREGEWMITR